MSSAEDVLVERAKNLVDQVIDHIEQRLEQRLSRAELQRLVGMGLATRDILRDLLVRGQSTPEDDRRIAEAILKAEGILGFCPPPRD